MLQRMQAATHNISYHGTLVFLQDGQVQSMRVVHKADEKGQFERLINLNGVAREVVRRDDVVVCYMPDSKEVMVSRQKFKGNLLSQLAASNFERLQSNYRFFLEPTERIAGRKAQRILIQPNDELRYGYRLWVDVENAILLKSDLLGEKGESLEQTMFATISVVDHIPEDLLKPTSTGEGFTWFEHEPEKTTAVLKESDWRIASLPMGFSVSSRSRHHMPGSSAQSEHWVLSDGLASISIYFEKAEKNQEPFEGASPMGAVNAFGAMNSKHQVTVIGEVPAQTVKQLAQSIEFTADTEQ